MYDFGVVDTFIDLSPSAKKEILRQLNLHHDPEAGVRIIVVIDRYVGYVFDLEFDIPKPNDHVAKIDGIKIFTNKTFLDFVKGMKVDFDISSGTFSLKNENPTYNCVPGAKFECPSCNL